MTVSLMTRSGSSSATLTQASRLETMAESKSALCITPKHTTSERVGEANASMK